MFTPQPLPLNRKLSQVDGTLQSQAHILGRDQGEASQVPRVPCPGGSPSRHCDSVGSSREPGLPCSPWPWPCLCAQEDMASSFPTSSSSPGVSSLYFHVHQISATALSILFCNLQKRLHFMKVGIT